MFNPKCWRCFQSPQNLKHIQNTALWYVCTCDHYSPKDVYPNCLQTTWASRLSHPLPHTVPHSLSTQISTLPSRWLDPPTKRIWPWEQFAGTGINSTVPNHKWCFTWTWKFDDGNHYFCLFQFLVFKLEFTTVGSYIYIPYIRLSKYFQAIVLVSCTLLDTFHIDTGLRITTIMLWLLDKLSVVLCSVLWAQAWGLHATYWGGVVNLILRTAIHILICLCSVLNVCCALPAILSKWQTTCASDSNIFTVLAAVDPNSMIWAAEKRGLGSSASNIVEKDSTTASAKAGIAVSCSTWWSCQRLLLVNVFLHKP